LMIYLPSGCACLPIDNQSGGFGSKTIGKIRPKIQQSTFLFSKIKTSPIVYLPKKVTIIL
jgi:hypothetical protein